MCWSNFKWIVNGVVCHCKCIWWVNDIDHHGVSIYSNYWTRWRQTTLTWSLVMAGSGHWHIETSTMPVMHWHGTPTYLTVWIGLLNSNVNLLHRFRTNTTVQSPREWGGFDHWSYICNIVSPLRDFVVILLPHFFFCLPIWSVHFCLSIE